VLACCDIIYEEVIKEFHHHPYQRLHEAPDDVRELVAMALEPDLKLEPEKEAEVHSGSRSIHPPIG
jgi:hypothetical protein